MSAPNRFRSIAVVGFLAGGGLGIISSTQTWLTATRSDGGEDIAVVGTSALPLLAPLSLAVLALGAVLAIIGPVLRHIVAALGVLAGAGLLWATAVIVLEHPLSAVATAVTEATGLAGDEAIAGIVDGVVVAVWPYVALAGWIVLLAAGVFALVTARRWTTGGRRYRTDAPSHGFDGGPVDAIDSWDDLSRGTDPTR